MMPPSKLQSFIYSGPVHINPPPVNLNQIRTSPAADPPTPPPSNVIYNHTLLHTKYTNITMHVLSVFQNDNVNFPCLSSTSRNASGVASDLE